MLWVELLQIRLACFRILFFCSAPVQNADEKELQSLEALWASKAAAKKKLQAECVPVEYTSDTIRHPANVRLVGTTENLMITMASIGRSTKPQR